MYADIGEVASPRAVLTRERRSVMMLGLIAIPGRNAEIEETILHVGCWPE